ncbi:MAG: right-handed parallel beta-helix repeat-containing protein [Anaerolineales bacterium]|nr:right-handed parallel beta-helix repeat-containing protein [Anaerolineales bacterium]
METRRHFHYIPPMALVVTVVFLTMFFSVGDSRNSFAGKVLDVGCVRTVTSSADSGDGTFRQALFEASAGDTILFSSATFSPTNPATITLASCLPAIVQDNLTVDGSDAGVILDGNATCGQGCSGLGIEADNVQIYGLQIVNFPGNGIELRGQNNTIGGDENLVGGPLGRGNLLSKNGGAGIALLESGTYSNTIRGNLIGVDPAGALDWGNGGDGIHINSASYNLITENVISGNGGNGIQGCCNTGSSHNAISQNMIGVGNDGQQAIPNEQNGVWFHDGASNNVVGPGNIIAYNGGSGVMVHTPASRGNTITANSMFGNSNGIFLLEGGNSNISPPMIVEFDLPTGFLAGFSCAGCQVEIFSDDNGQGQWFEGQSTADSNGYFTFNKGSALTGPHLTATATGSAGNTSEYSSPTSGASGSATIQTGNTNRPTYYQSKKSIQLADNGFSTLVSGLWNLPNPEDPINCQSELGIKVMRATINEGDSWNIDWEQSEFDLDPANDAFFSMTIEAGMAPIYNLVFWDKATHQANGSIDTPRFTKQEEIDRYLEFVDFIVGHFKDRIGAYELWNEPAWDGMPLQWIRVDDYISMTLQAIPRIRTIRPDAKIVVGSVAGMDAPEMRNWLLTLIQNEDVMSLADAVSWHPFFGASPEDEQYRQYYAEYPALVSQIKTLARENGFTGQFRADELVYNSPDECPGDPCDPANYIYSDADAAKYMARAIVLHAGMDVAPGPLVGCHRQAATPTKILATLLDGAQAESFPFELTTTMTNVLSYTFSLPGGDRMIAFWDHNAAMEEYPQSELSLRLPGLAGSSAYGIDLLTGIQQKLLVSVEENDLVIHVLLLRDYPLLVLLKPDLKVYLPVVIKS